MQAVESECRAHDRGVLLVDTGDSSEIERQTIEMLLDRRIDALLVSPVHFSLSRPVLRAAAKRTTVIQLDRRADDELGFVQMDHADAMEQVIDHFRALRRTKLAFVGSNPSVSTSFDRQNAFMKLAQQSDPGATSRVVTGDFTVEWGRQAASDLMRRWPGIDGIVCADDLIALGVKQSLQGAGIAVPGRVGVVGFDDTIIASSGQLTSVRQPLADLARAVVSLCLSGEARTRAVHMSFRAELVVRASTDARHSSV